MISFSLIERCPRRLMLGGGQPRDKAGNQIAVFPKATTADVLPLVHVKYSEVVLKSHAVFDRIRVQLAVGISVVVPQAKRSQVFEIQRAQLFLLPKPDVKLPLARLVLPVISWLQVS